jgi:formylglycine-generating enzyme required for sulfatase activity
MQDRRAFIRIAASTGVVIAIRHLAHADPLDAIASTQPNTLLGRRAGEERTVEGVPLCWCPPRRFVMGSPTSEAGRRPDEAQVAVTLSRGFWIGKFEVTQGQWKRVNRSLPGQGPSAEFGIGDEVPVYWVNFPAAEGFCRALSGQARRSGALPAGWEFRLPTEAQWEYACRAGTTTANAFGDRLTTRQANIKGAGSRGRAAPVGSYPPNPWGIHDMHGNIYEWCRDWYHARLPGGSDPDLSGERGLQNRVQNRDGTYSRVRRGGAWNDESEWCRSALRLRYEPPRSSDHIGFRIALVPEGTDHAPTPV